MTKDQNYSCFRKDKEITGNEGYLMVFGGDCLVVVDKADADCMSYAKLGYGYGVSHKWT
jgi:hypothetical protein